MLQAQKVSNLLSTNVVVILVSVYNNKHRVDYSTIHYIASTYNMLHTTNKKFQKVPFPGSHAIIYIIGEHIYFVISA